jgi:hypothetical protein
MTLDDRARSDQTDYVIEKMVCVHAAMQGHAASMANLAHL